MVQAGNGDVVGHAQHAHDTGSAPVLRQQGDALLDGVGRAMDLDLLALVGNLALGVGTNAEHAFHQLGTLSAHQAGHAQNLALVQLKAAVAEAAGVNGGKVLHLQHHFVAGLVLTHGVQVGQLTTHHLGDDKVGGQALAVPGADVLAIAHDGHFVGNAQDLVHLMADVDDGNAFLFQIINDAEQRLNLVGSQRRGGLVQNQHLAVGADSLGDFHRLHLRHAQLAQLLLGVEVHAHPLQQGGGVLIHFFMIHHREGTEFLGGIAAKIDVFCHTAGGHGLKLLVHHGDALAQRVQGIGDVHLLALVVDLALIHLVNAEHTFHQRGLACAVFAHQRMHMSGLQLELGMVQRLHTREGFDHAFHLQAVL